MSRCKIEIVYRSKENEFYVYPTTWANLKLTAKHIGEIWSTYIVNIRVNGNHFGTLFTNYGM